MLDVDLHLNYFPQEIFAGFSVGKGAVIGLFGPSGVGKSSILKCVAGLEKLSSGSIVYDSIPWNQDEKILTRPQERHVGFIFQDFALFPNMTVQENIAFGQKVEYQELDEIISTLGIKDIIKKRPQFLSGGQKQRVAIARALVSNPRILLLDEPFSSLDDENKTRIKTLLKDKIRTKKLITILASHDREDMRFFDCEVIHVKNQHLS